MSQSNNRFSQGFSLVEVMVAIAVLAIGMMSMAYLMGRTMSDTNRSRFMSQASTLASEKLEDLNRYPAADPHVATPGGATMGSLTADRVQMVTSSGVTLDVNYFDDIILSSNAGAVAETASGLDAGGNSVYTTTSHTPNGQITTSASNNPPGLITFKRRWIIEPNTPVNGVRRVTVLVMLQDRTVQPPVSFQMSTVRP